MSTLPLVQESLPGIWFGAGRRTSRPTAGEVCLSILRRRLYYPTGAIIIGIAAGVAPFFACTKLKSLFHYDDALDTFGIHAVGGMLGAFLTGLLATPRVNPNLSGIVATQSGLARIIGHTLWFEQLKAILVTIAFAVIGTTMLGALVKAAVGLRIAAEIERQGRDINEHGEEGYMTT